MNSPKTGWAQPVFPSKHKVTDTALRHAIDPSHGHLVFPEMQIAPSAVGPTYTSVTLGSVDSLLVASAEAGPGSVGGTASIQKTQAHTTAVA